MGNVLGTFRNSENTSPICILALEQKQTMVYHKRILIKYNFNVSTLYVRYNTKTIEDEDDKTKNPRLVSFNLNNIGSNPFKGFNPYQHMVNSLYINTPYIYPHETTGNTLQFT